MVEVIKIEGTDIILHVRMAYIMAAEIRQNIIIALPYCIIASLLVERRKMIFYNKILRSSNIVLRILSALHRNEAQKFLSAYNILPGQSRNIDIKRAVWSSFVRLFTI